MIPWRRLAVVVTIATSVGIGAHAEEPAASPSSDSFEAIKKEYENSVTAYVEETKAAIQRHKDKGGKDEDFQFTKPFPGAEFSPRFLAVAEKAPNGPDAIKALRFALQTSQGPDRKPLETQSKAIAIIRNHYTSKPEIKPLLNLLARLEAPEARALVDDVIANNPDRTVQVKAYRSLLNQCEVFLSFPKFIQDAKNRALVEERQGKEYITNQLAKAEKAKVDSEAFKKILREKYADIVADLSIGQPAPEVTSHDLDGKTTRLADYKGKVVVLDIWATWCGPCKAMIPHEREMVERLKAKPFALVSVSVDNKLETLKQFLAKEKMPWIHWWEGPEGKLVEDWDIHYFPTIYVLDAQGIIRHKDLRGEELEKAVNALLEEVEIKAAD